MLYTSYFAKLRNLPQDVVPVAICAKIPDWYSGLYYRKLAPSYDILMNYRITGDEQKYRQQYWSGVLKKLTVAEVRSDLRKLLELNGYTWQNTIALICYESPEKFCHRHLVSEWMRACGIQCREWE